MRMSLCPPPPLEWRRTFGRPTLPTKKLPPLPTPVHSNPNFPQTVPRPQTKTRTDVPSDPTPSARKSHPRNLCTLATFPVGIKSFGTREGTWVVDTEDASQTTFVPSTDLLPSVRPTLQQRHSGGSQQRSSFQGVDTLAFIRHRKSEVNPSAGLFNSLPLPCRSLGLSSFFVISHLGCCFFLVMFIYQHLPRRS